MDFPQLLTCCGRVFCIFDMLNDEEDDVEDEESDERCRRQCGRAAS